MNWELVLKLVPVALVIIQGLFGWALWSLSKKFKSCEECKVHRDELAQACVDCSREVDGRLDIVEQRSVRVDAALENLPRASDMHQLASALEKLSGTIGKDIEALRGGQKALDQAVNGLSARLEDSVKGLGVSIDGVRNQVTLLIENELNGGK